MLVEVPAPPWITSTTNCSCSLPARISSAGGDDGVSAGRIEQAELVVAPGRGLLDRGQRRDQVRIDRDRGAGDRKVLDRAQRVDAVVGVRRHIAVAQQIVFASRGHRKTLSPGCFANPDEIRKGRLFQALLLTIAGSPQTGAIRHASGGPAPRGPSQFAEAT